MLPDIAAPLVRAATIQTGLLLVQAATSQKPMDPQVRISEHAEFVLAGLLPRAHLRLVFTSLQAYTRSAENWIASAFPLSTETCNDVEPPLALMPIHTHLDDLYRSVMPPALYWMNLEMVTVRTLIEASMPASI